MYKQFGESNNNERGREGGISWMHWKGASRRLSAVGGETDETEILIGEKVCRTVNTGERTKKRLTWEAIKKISDQ